MPGKRRKGVAKPGLGILKFWQGSVEIILRSSIIVRRLNKIVQYINYIVLQGFCVVVLVATSLGIYQIETDLPGTILQIVDIQIKETLNKDYSTLVVTSIAAFGLGLGISVATLLAETILIVLRFVNFTLINYKIKVFLSIVSQKHHSYFYHDYFLL